MIQQNNSLARKDLDKYFPNFHGFILLFVLIRILSQEIFLTRITSSFCFIALRKLGYVVYNIFWIVTDIFKLFFILVFILCKRRRCSYSMRPAFKVLAAPKQQGVYTCSGKFILLYFGVILIALAARLFVYFQTGTGRAVAAPAG